MTSLGWVGVWLLVASSVAIVVECVVGGMWGMRLARRSQEVSAMLEREQGAIRADLVRLQAAMEETKVLWEPFGRMLKFVRHPLVLALIGYYRRRWAT